MRTLKAKKSNFKKEFFNHKLELEKLDINSEVYKLADIFGGIDQSKREHFESFKKLKENILAEGMINPIVLTTNRMDYYNWGFLGIREELILPHEDKPYLCIFGTQRLHIAEQEGYDSIDAYFIEDVNYGLLIGKVLES